jgi:predicted ABC-type ATPase
VLAGGHDVPEATIRRRFERGRRNFFDRYAAMSTAWRLYDASPVDGPALIATGEEDSPPRILDDARWIAASEAER